MITSRRLWPSDSAPSSTRPPSACTSGPGPGSTTFFDGLELVPPYEGAEPGICYTGVWGAEDPVLADSDGARWLYCGVARKP